MKIDRKQKRWAEKHIFAMSKVYVICIKAEDWLRNKCTEDNVCDLAYAWEKCIEPDWLLWVTARQKKRFDEKLLVEVLQVLRKFSCYMRRDYEYLLAEIKAIKRFSINDIGFVAVINNMEQEFHECCHDHGQLTKKTKASNELRKILSNPWK